MKTKFLALTLAAFVLPQTGNAATFFFSFDSEMDGTGTDTFNTMTGQYAITANSGFAGTPTVLKGGSNLKSGGDGGEASFFDFQGNEWLGGGDQNVPGHTAGWNPGSTGNSFSTTFSTVGLTDVTLRFSIRAAGSAPPEKFSAFSYDTGGGPVADTSFENYTRDGNNFFAYTADLTAIDAIEGQSSVTLRWDFANLNSGSSYRIDNLEVSAVPEPSSALLGFAGLSLAFLRRKR